MNKITIEHIESKIAKEDYFVIPNTTITICILTLENGFTVTGESACVNPSNFDEEIGRKYARENAFEHIWELEGYLLKQKMYETSEAKRQLDLIHKHIYDAYSNTLPLQKDLS